MNDTGPSMGATLEKLGFTNLQVKTVKAPHAPWAKDAKYKDLGALMYGMGLSPEEAKALTVKGVEEVKEDRVHAYSFA